MRATKFGIFHDIYNQPYDERTRIKLYTSSKGSQQLIQRMSLLKRLKVHNGCVNSICWNSSGTLILSGSDDLHLVLSNPYNYQVLTDYKTSHRANIFSAKFLPNSGDHRIVSCSGDGIILYTDLLRKTATFQSQFTCHSGTTYQISTIPGESDSFLSCGEDGTVRCFDLRVKEKCNTPRCKEDVIIECQRAVTALSVNPLMPHQVAIGCSDSSVRMFDRRMLATREPAFTDNEETAWPIAHFTVPEFDGNSYRITSLSYSPDGQDVLVSYSSDHLYLFGVKGQKTVKLRKDSLMSKNKNKKHPLRSPQPVRRLRLRGDWSDTGPDARPAREGGRRSDTEIAQARPFLHTSLMQRMTDVLSRMLNDPATRAALNGGGEDNLEGWVIDQHGEGQQNPTEANNVNAEAGERTNESTTTTTTTTTTTMEQQRSGDSETINETRNEEIVAATSGETSSPIVAIQTSDDAVETESTDQQTVSNDPDNAETEQSQVSTDCVTAPLERTTEEETRVNDANECVHDECESSQPEASKGSIQSFTSLSITRQTNVEGRETNASDVGATVSSLENARDGSMMENLQDRLTTMRDGFLERHGSEPAVSLTYSDKSSTGATISLGVADEVIRDSYHPGPSGSQNADTNIIEDAGPSNSLSRQSNYSDAHEQTDEDVYNDSDEDDDEDAESSSSSGRMASPTGLESRGTDEDGTSKTHEFFDGSRLIDYRVKQKYTGHRNASFFRTMIKEANFWGDDHVMSGSDCGHVFVWERSTAKLCMLLEADQHVVNCLQPHPYLPMLATSGIDYDVKLWAPISEEASFDNNFAEDLQNRNAVMLEETKDTITVPAVFMIRMLACLNQIRRGRGRHRRRSGDEADELRGG